MKRMTSGTWMMMSESIIESGEITQTFQKYSLKEILVRMNETPRLKGALVFYFAFAVVSSGW